MISYAFTTRTILDSRKLTVYLYRFFKNIKAKNRYIKVYVSLNTRNNKNVRLTDMYLIDFKENDGIRTFKQNIYASYYDFCKDNKPENIKNIIFNYIKLNRKQYLDQIDSIINNS